MGEHIKVYKVHTYLFASTRISKIKRGGWVKNAMLIWIDLCLSIILCNNFVYITLLAGVHSNSFYCDKWPCMVKVVWSYLPFAWGTSFRNGGLPLNKNCFFLNNSKKILCKRSFIFRLLQ